MEPVVGSHQRTSRCNQKCWSRIGLIKPAEHNQKALPVTSRWSGEAFQHRSGTCNKSNLWVSNLRTKRPHQYTHCCLLAVSYPQKQLCLHKGRGHFCQFPLLTAVPCAPLLWVRCVRGNTGVCRLQLLVEIAPPLIRQINCLSPTGEVLGITSQMTYITTKSFKFYFFFNNHYLNQCKKMYLFKMTFNFKT